MTKFLSVENPPYVRNVLCSPGMDDPVYEVEVRGPQVSEAEGHHQVEDRVLGEVGEGEDPGGPVVAEDDLQEAGNEAGGECDQGVVDDLAGVGVGGRHLVLGQLGLERGEVEEPVPGAADDESGRDVPQEDVRDPVSGELGTTTKCGVDLAKLSL